MLFQHVQALQSLGAAPDQMQNPRGGKGKYEGKVTQNNKKL
jgi:hypothetical protein